MPYKHYETSKEGKVAGDGNPTETKHETAKTLEPENKASYETYGTNEQHRTFQYIHYKSTFWKKHQY